MNKLALLLSAAFVLSACKGEDPQAAAAAQAAAKEQAAAPVLQQYEAAVAGQQWELARAHADALQWQHKGTQAAAKAMENYEEIRAKAEAAREERRLAGLWRYDDVVVKDAGTQKTASIYAKDRVDVDGSGDKPVRLIFRDHPEWGRSAYLVLEAGDFRCPGGCKVQVKADGVAAKAMAATRPNTDEAIAMFIEDERALWRLARKSKTISIEFPVKAGGTRSAAFEVGGLDGASLPGWD
ncbi:hypothetical protein IP90_02352 [Luteimonas cucumeris]|uniref:Lipoprotein n=1 Tax=Luteimonas cucumeris TaxID=985012 RepID=A0A562L2D5_9GAMM|nr:hypothetical protein [Luteimonas cucumeris]TWI01792.1 hypothetical protein IP90_02352 [Luteimonas cucumeris]